MDDILLKSKERILWQHSYEKNRLSIMIDLICILFFLSISLSIGFFITNFFIFLIFLVTSFGAFLLINFMLYNWKIKRGFPIEKEELKNYKEYDIITNQRLIQKHFIYNEFEVPERWLEWHASPHFGKFHRDYYPETLLKKEGDTLILDLEKINIISAYRDGKKIFFLDKFIIIEGEYRIDYSLQFPGLGFAFVDFGDNQAREKILQQLKKTLNLTKTVDNQTGRIYKKKSIK